MAASSYYDNDANYQAAYGRLHGSRGDGWCAASSSSDDDWLQVNLGRMIHVCGVATQGDGTHDPYDEWVTDFKLSFSSDGSTWTTYKDGHGADKVRFRVSTGIHKEMGTLTFVFSKKRLFVG